MWRAGRAVVLALILAGCTTAGGKPPVGAPPLAPGPAALPPAPIAVSPTGATSDMGHHGSYAVAPNGRFLAEAPYMGGEVTLHDLTTGEQTRSGESYDSAAPRHADGSAGEYRAWVHSFSPDSRLFAFSVTEGAKQTLHVIDPSWEYQPRKFDDWAGSLVWLGNERDFLYDTHAGDGIAVHLNGTPLATHAGGKHLGLSGDHPSQALSRDGQRLAYTVELADRQSQLIVAELTTGEVRTLPDSTGLLPLMWTTDGQGLVVAEMASHKTRTVPTAGGEVLVPSRVSAGWKADKPLWGEPGTTVFEAALPDSPRPLSRVFAPLTFRGRTLQPVFTGQGTHFLRQEGAAVYSDGYLSLAETLAVLEKPRLLYRLPLTLGATFTLEYQHHNFGTTFWTYRVAGFETVRTPAGEREAVLLESERGRTRDWWVPGIGRVRMNETTAARIETGKPVALPVAARLDERTTGFLVGSLQVQDQDGTVLLDEAINPYRSQVWWADGGAPAPIVLHFTHSQAEPNLTYGGYVYQRATHSFELIRWRLPDGRTKTALAGDLQQVEGQAAIRLRDDEHYPLFSECLFRWDGERMACSRYTGGTPAREEADVARDLTRPLDEESWARIFRDPEAGRAAYRATRTDEGRNRLAYQTARTEGDGSWVFTSPGMKVRFTIVHEGDAWLVATWRIE